MVHIFNVNTNTFCICCGKQCFLKQRHKISPLFTKVYKKYFKITLLTSKWTPNSVCGSCYATLMKWHRGKNVHLAFGSPMFWKEAKSPDECYFCLNDFSGINIKKKKQLSTLKVPHLISQSHTSRNC